ncbi:carbon-nitrogen hydrolase family protein [Lachnospiraceae bacterium 54-53]
MKIALAQMKMKPTMEENLNKSIQLIGQAASCGAGLILFPELQLSPFFPQYEKQDALQYQLTPDHEFIGQISSTCGRHGIMASPNVYLQESGQNYDASLFIDENGRIKGISKMVHIMQGEYFYEQDYYTPSDDGFKVYDTPEGKIGIVICFDRHLPESIRSCAALGADLVLIPTANVEGEPLDMFEWELRVQAMQSSVFLAMCNRTGREDRMNFIGQSIVVDPNGDVIAKADADEQILYAETDLGQSRVIRDARPYFKLRRPEWYY